MTQGVSDRPWQAETRTAETKVKTGLVFGRYVNTY